jgi:hypothetical protein
MFNAIINNILPEVSSLNSEGNIEGIGQRIGFLLEVSGVVFFFWVSFGVIAGSSIIPIIFRPTFEISAIGAFSIFFIASAIIVTSLLTEVLIGIEAERAVGRSWILPAVFLPAAAITPWEPIISTGIVLGLYLLAVICLLGYALHVGPVSVSPTGFDHTVFN